MNGLDKKLCEVYSAMEGSDAYARYSIRHGIESAAILTVLNDDVADLIAAELAPRIAGKTVVEVGGGIGLLSLHLGRHAKRVYCIEANPMWSWTFAEILLTAKPKNVSYLFGSADEFAGQIKGDVALICTHSDVQGMKATAALFAPVVIDFYGDLIAANPKGFDPVGRFLREFV